MTVRHVIHTPATRANLDAAYDWSPPHLRPVIGAVRDHGVGMLFVGQSANPFRLPHDPKRSAIVIIGDDFDKAVGPEGFHMPSIRRVIRVCMSFAVVSSAPPPAVYSAMAAAAAISRKNTFLVETRPEQEIQWVNLIQKLAPRRFVWLATVEGGHA